MKEMVSAQPCNYRVMDARGRFLSTKEALESHEAIAECDSSFLSD